MRHRPVAFPAIPVVMVNLLHYITVTSQTVFTDCLAAALADADGLRHLIGVEAIKVPDSVDPFSGQFNRQVLLRHMAVAAFGLHVMG